MSSVNRFYKYLIEDYKPYRTDKVSHLYLIKKGDDLYELKIQDSYIISTYLIVDKEFVPELSQTDLETLNRFFRKEIIKDYLS